MGSGDPIQIDRHRIQDRRGDDDQGHDRCAEGTMIDRRKFAQIRSEIIADKGDLTLFALFLREGAVDRWDLLVSASWFQPDKAAGLRYLAKKLTAKLSEREMIELSRIVVIEQNDPGLRKLLRDTTVEDGEIREIENMQFAGISLSRAIIFEAKPATLATVRRGD